LTFEGVVDGKVNILNNKCFKHGKKEAFAGISGIVNIHIIGMFCAGGATIA